MFLESASLSISIRLLRIRRISSVPLISIALRCPAPRIEPLRRWGELKLPNEIRPESHQDGKTYGSVYRCMYADRSAATITTGIGTPGQGRFTHPTRARLITPQEAARIQCFPDGYGFEAPKGNTTRKELAKWIGDAVPPLLGMMAVSAALSEASGTEPNLPW
ncbi:DNA cytosine methyltransferase [Flavimaricola marinus]|uniref:DNA cytosine methyltransferase n=1 Tax=Flavimaricola marinus TaxID=1819565 RepID=UPI003521889D